MNKYLIASIWVIVIGIIFGVCGLIIGGAGVTDIGKWFAAGHGFVYDVGIALVWGGIILFIIGLFGIITSLIKAHSDK